MTHAVVARYPWLRAIVPDDNDPSVVILVREMSAELLHHSPVVVHQTDHYWAEAYHFVWKNGLYLDAVRPTCHLDSSTEVKGETLGDRLLVWWKQGQCPEFIVYQSIWYEARGTQVLQGRVVIVYPLGQELVEQYVTEARSNPIVINRPF